MNEMNEILEYEIDHHEMNDVEIENREKIVKEENEIGNDLMIVIHEIEIHAIQKTQEIQEIVVISVVHRHPHHHVKMMIGKHK